MIFKEILTINETYTDVEVKCSSYIGMIEMIEKGKVIKVEDNENIYYVNSKYIVSFY